MVHPKLRVILFLLAINLVGTAAAWVFLDRATWLWVLPIALSINFLLWTYDHVLVFSQLVSEPLIGQDPWGLLKVVHELSERYQLSVPEVHLIDHAYAQIFCYARTRRRSRLFVTRGALDLLSKRELRATLTFQMCVMNSSFSILNYWLAALIDLCWRLGVAIERTLAFVFGWRPRVAKLLVAPWIWGLQHLLLSPRDYQKLDRETSARLQEPEDLARALWKLESYAQTQPWADPWVFSHMCMVSPLSQRFGLRALQSQPPLAARIESLIGRYPL